MSIAKSRPIRHHDLGAVLFDFSDVVLVRCPRCARAGHVVAQAAERQARFTCGGCGLRLDSAAKDWQGPVLCYGRRTCERCGFGSVEHRSLHATPPRPFHPLRTCPCPRCGHANPLQVKLSPHPSSDPPGDPWFGLPLLLQATLPWGVLWAYNPHHLEALRGYVQAQLREQHCATKNTMFARLPDWMKAARHRPRLLKAIGMLTELAACDQP